MCIPYALELKRKHYVKRDPPDTLRKCQGSCELFVPHFLSQNQQLPYSLFYWQEVKNSFSQNFMTYWCFFSNFTQLLKPFHTDQWMLLKHIYRVGRAANHQSTMRMCLWINLLLLWWTSIPESVQVKVTLSAELKPELSCRRSKGHYAKLLHTSA